MLDISETSRFFTRLGPAVSIGNCFISPNNNSLKMNESDAEFKAKYMEMVESVKGEAGKTSSLMRVEKRERIIRCLQNPELEPNCKFRARVKERKYRLLQQGNEVFLGVPDESSGELVYRRAACLEEFWDIINTAHVENGHIGVVHTFAAIRRLYALLPRYLVSRYVHMCPVCAHTSGSTRGPKAKKFKTSGASNSSSVVNIAPAPASVGEEGQANPSQDVTTLTVDETEDGRTVITVQNEDPVSVTEAPSDISLVEAPAPVLEPISSDIKVVFTCHICDQQFEKKLLYQRHIRSHSEHNPTIPFVSLYKPPAADKRCKQERRSFGSTARGRQVIIDGDMGIEAAQALMLAVCRSDLIVVAVTCVSGVVSIENACNNALRVLRVCSREDVKVFCGAERPLVGKMCQSHDNLPGVSWQSSVDTSQIKSEHAVSAMIRLVNGNPGKITLVCLGPLTNLALALRLDPQMSKKLKEVFILGGNIEGRGDSSVCAEQNFHYDPEAAYAVLEETPNITLLPYEVCDRHKLTGDFFDSWVHLGTEKSEFVRGMGNANWLQEHRKNGYASFCAFAMAVVADRSIALEKKTVYATVELSGTLARGMMVVDWARKLGCEMNVDLVRSLDLGKIQSLLIGMVEEAEAMEIYTV